MFNTSIAQINMYIILYDQMRFTILSRNQMLVYREEGKTGVPRWRKTSRSRVENQPTQPTQGSKLTLLLRRLRGKIWSPDHKFWSPTYLMHSFHKNMILNFTFHARKVIIQQLEKITTGKTSKHGIRQGARPHNLVRTIC